MVPTSPAGTTSDIPEAVWEDTRERRSRWSFRRRGASSPPLRLAEMEDVAVATPESSR